MTTTTYHAKYFAAEVKADSAGRSALLPQGRTISYPYGDDATPTSFYLKKLFSGHLAP